MNDSDAEMDASYSQRRMAEHFFVSLLTDKHHLIVSSAVGSRTELEPTSLRLELEQSTRTVLAISQSPLKLRSITHDEHQGVTTMMSSSPGQSTLPPMTAVQRSWRAIGRPSIPLLLSTRGR